MHKPVLLDIYPLYTAESCSRRIPTTGCQDMKFAEQNRSFTASAMLRIFISLFYVYFGISRLFLFYFRLSNPGVWGGWSGARGTVGIEEKCVQKCGRETCVKER